MTFYAPSWAAILACLVLGMLFCGCAFLIGARWNDERLKDQDRPEWVLEVLDDFQEWGSVDWSDIGAKANVHCNMMIHHRASSFYDGMFLHGVITRFNALKEHKVFNHIYHGRNLRIRNKRTNEIIPTEAL